MHRLTRATGMTREELVEQAVLDMAERSDLLDLVEGTWARRKLRIRRGGEPTVGRDQLAPWWLGPNTSRLAPAERAKLPLWPGSPAGRARGGVPMPERKRRGLAVYLAQSGDGAQRHDRGPHNQGRRPSTGMALTHTRSRRSAFGVTRSAARRTAGLLAAVPEIRVVRCHGTELMSRVCAPVRRRPSKQTPCAPLPGLLCKPIGLRHPGGGEADAGTLWAELALTFMRPVDQDVSRPTPGTAPRGYAPRPSRCTSRSLRNTHLRRVARARHRYGSITATRSTDRPS